MNNKRLYPVQIHAESGHRVSSLKTIEVLREKDYFVLDQTVSGDAPKDFIAVYEYGNCIRSRPATWPRYIAKVGHKWYPNESITEHLLTETGKLLGIEVANSKRSLCSKKF